MSPRRIVLVGFMGSGKTSVGRALAGRLGWAFRDLDRWIEERTGLSVARIFAERGEDFFREQERRAAEAALALEHAVIAAGGGAFAQPATRELLQRDAVTVWLRCAIEAIERRVPLDGTRPLATDRETIRRLLDQREASYRLADQTVETTDIDPMTAAGQIADLVFAATPSGRENASG